ncbi:MAG TPA: hypothetical protein ENN58_00420, partial [bacterium]|nr:hypothetical protein [bacterium]
MRRGCVAYGLILIPFIPLLNILPSPEQSLFYLSDVLVLSVIFWTIAFSLASKSYCLMRTDIDLPFLGYSLISALAVLVPMVSKSDVEGNIRLFKILFESYFIYYTTVAILVFRRDILEKVIFATLIVCSIISILAVFQFLKTGSVPGSVFNDSEMLSIYLTLVLPLALGVLVYSDERVNRVLAAAAFLSGGMALFLSYSRAGWISGAVTSLILAIHYLFFADRYLRTDRAGRHRKKKALFVILTLSSLLCLWFCYVERLVRDIFYARFMSIFSDYTLGGRVDLWKSAWRLIQDSPLLGHGAFPNVYNLYLQVAGQFGLVALAFFFFLFLKFFGVVFIRLKNVKSPRERGIVVAGSLGVLGLLIVGMAESSLGSRMSPLFWMQVGMVMALQKMADNRQGRASGSHLHMSLARN